MSHTATSHDDEITGINVVPLVDIVLVLLIVFMVTANFMAKPAIEMKLPSADSGEAKERNQFSLLLGKDGSIAIGDTLVEESAIQQEFQKKLDEYKTEKRQSLEAQGLNVTENKLTVLARNELTMIIQADTVVSHGRVIHFVDEARKIGIVNYAFNVDPAAAAKAPVQAAKQASLNTDQDNNGG